MTAQMNPPSSWTAFARSLDLVTAFGALLLVVWLIDRYRRKPHNSRSEIAALALTAAWCLIAAARGAGDALTLLAEVARNLAWLLMLHRLFVRDYAEAAVRPVLVALALVELVQVPLSGLSLALVSIPAAAAVITKVSALCHLLTTIVALVLVHNLYVGAVAARRGAVRWRCLALAVIWGYDLNYYTVVWLVQAVPAELVALRALAQGLAVAMIGVAARSGGSLRLSPSRAVAFQSLMLLLIGAYLIVMVGAAQSVAWLGGDIGGLVQLGFAAVTTVVIIVSVPSARLRRWLNAILARHLFQHRYDYRAEWLRFARTIGRADAAAEPLHARVVQALADITDSARGVLLVPDDHGALVLSARWQWPTLAVPARALDAAAMAALEQAGAVVDLDAFRTPDDQAADASWLPPWLIDDPAIWVLVPLRHFERLVGLVVLGRPAQPRELDWEDTDLLRVVGQQVASVLAEHASHAALMEAGRFDEFNRRIAFVMHDIKNLASQLALLARNAERHADNPAFRSDMLITLRNAADKLNALIARLSRYGAGAVADSAPVDAAHVIATIARRSNATLGREHVTARCDTRCEVMAARDMLDQVLTHLVQNALDATTDQHAVVLQCRAEGSDGVIEVIDHGTGMSADFVRNRLFTPFVSTKPGGFGIGAFEARELIVAMGGQLHVESTEGQGSRFTIRLPLAHAPQLDHKAALT